MVDLDSNPTKLIEVVEIGKQMLITRGALTTFSVANDIAKYFAIIPTIFAAAGIGALNIMGLKSAQSAIVSALIYNALGFAYPPAAFPFYYGSVVGGHLAGRMQSRRITPSPEAGLTPTQHDELRSYPR